MTESEPKPRVSPQEFDYPYGEDFANALETLYRGGQLYLDLLGEHVKWSIQTLGENSAPVEKLIPLESDLDEWLNQLSDIIALAVIPEE